MAEQAQELLCEPIKCVALRHDKPGTAAHPLIIVVDGLDECEDFTGSYGEQLFTVIIDHLRQLGTPVKLFFTSRPETDLQGMFDYVFREASNDYLVVHQLHEADVHVQQDIRTHLAGALRHIRERSAQLSLAWPSPECLDDLAGISKNLFVHAATVVRWIGMRGCSPEAQLDELFSWIGQPVPVDEISPYKELDRLYSTILEKAGGERAETKNSTRSRQMRRILDCIIHGCTPLHLDKLAEDTGMPRHICMAILGSLASVLLLPNNMNNRQDTVRVFHRSFSDYMTDPRRCSDERFFIQSR